MKTAALVSVEEYLATSYEPDCDYVDGELIERNLGTKDHSTLQGEILAWFRERRRGIPNIWVLDPVSRRGWTIKSEGHLEALDGVLRTSDFRVALPIADLFNADRI